MKCKAEKKLLSVIIASVLTLVLFIGMSISLTTYGAEQINYVERSWDGTQVVETTKTVACTPISMCGKSIGSGWYYLNTDKSYGSSSRVEISGEVNLILCDGITLTCNNGINVPEGSTLNIYGQAGGTGKLIAKGDTNNCAAIGGKNGQNCGTVVIHGGNVKADGYNDNEGEDGAGIGGGDSGSGGNITILGGNVEATGSNNGAGIGGGTRGAGGNITIYGGTVTANGGVDSSGIGGGDLGSSGTINIYGGKVTATGGSYGAGIGSGDESTSNGDITIYGGEVNATGGSDAAGIGGGNEAKSAVVTIKGGTVKAKCGKSNGSGIGGGDESGGGEVRISGGNVEATGGSGGAGIGGGDGGNGYSGNINITGGTVTANGGKEAAGIGGGNEGPEANNGTISITGGDVTATAGKKYGAGIGGGDKQNGGEIYIGGNAKVNATGGSNGAGIGAGDTANGGNIKIKGNADVTATGGHYLLPAEQLEFYEGAAGIGGGHGGDGGTIVIGSNEDGDSPDVKATSGYAGAGIGGGSFYGKSGHIEIYSGDIYALGRCSGPGIGSGTFNSDDNNVDVSIYGGNVTAMSEGFRDTKFYNNCYYIPGAAIGAAGNVQTEQAADKHIANRNRSIFSGSINLYGGNIKAGFSDGTSDVHDSVLIGGSIIKSNSKINISSSAQVFMESSPGYDKVDMMEATNINLWDDNGISSKVTIMERQTDGTWGKDYSLEKWKRTDYLNNNKIKSGAVLITPCTHEISVYTDEDAEYHIRTCDYCTDYSAAEDHDWYATEYSEDDDQKTIASHSCTRCRHEETWIVNSKQVVLNSGEIKLNKNTLTYGEALTEITFENSTAVFTEKDNSSNRIEGKINWKIPFETPEVGTHLAVWTFVPNSTEYANFEGTVEITVNKADPVIATIPKASAITIGQTLEKSVLYAGEAVHSVGEGAVPYGEEVAGTFAWADSSFTPELSDSNNTEYTVRFCPLDTKNFNEVTCQVKLAVNEKQIEVVAPAAKPNLTYTGTEQDLVYAGYCSEGAVMSYALGTDAENAPTEGYSEAVPTGKDIGTYYVWFKVQKGGADIEPPDVITVTIKSKVNPSPVPKPTPIPDEDYPVPIENKSAIDINAHISGGIATISDISSEAIEKVIRGDGREPSGDSTGKITIDISCATQTVTGIEIGKQTLDNLSNAVNNNAEIDAVEIKLTDTYVMLDGTAAESIASQAQGDTIRLKINTKTESSLNNAQRTALSAFSYRSPFEAYFESGGEKIRDFGGGQATVSVKQGIPEGMDARYFHIYYVPEDGAITVHKTWYENGMLSFKTGHFSDYSIVYDDTMRNDTLPEGFTRNTDGTLTFTDLELGTAIIADEVVREGKTYRMYNPNTGEHTFTKNAAEVYANVLSGWNHEEDGDFMTFGYDTKDSLIVYRLYSKYTGLHHYTMDRDEAIWNVQALGYNFEGIVFYALPSDSEGGTELYRLYNPYDYQHLWTTNKGEYDYLGSIGWNKEGVAFKVQ